MKALLWSLCSLAAVSAVAQPREPATASERSDVSLTIYNQNLSLIREERSLVLTRGIGTALVPDIPATIDGTSLHFRSMTAPDAVKVLEQSYQYDLVHQAKLLEKYVGKQIELIRLDPATEKEYSVPAKLLSTGFSTQQGYPGGYAALGGMIVEINGKVELNPSGRVVLPSLTEGLILKPRLEWLVSSTREGKHDVEISYLAGGLSWVSTYVALVDKNDAALDLTGWVTITNGSGTTFRNAGLKLVAGDVNRVKDDMMTEMKVMRANAAQFDASAPQFKQADLFEYKLYALQRRTDIHASETRQIELTSARDVKAKKVFLYDGLADQWQYWRNNYSYRSQGSFGQQSNPKVGVFMTFRNEETAGLGIPLPKGTVRVYKRDDDGREQFIGEDRIDHTPKDEEVRLYLGNAFDIVGERAQKDFKSYANGRVVEETIEIKVRNHKKESVEVLVYEHPWRWSQWEVVNSSTAWTKVDQTTLKFPVKVAKDGEAVVRYTIRYSW